MNVWVINEEGCGKKKTETKLVLALTTLFLNPAHIHPLTPWCLGPPCYLPSNRIHLYITGTSTTQVVGSAGEALYPKDQYPDDT